MGAVKMTNARHDAVCAGQAGVKLSRVTRRETSASLADPAVTREMCDAGASVIFERRDWSIFFSC